MIKCEERTLVDHGYRLITQAAVILSKGEPAIEVTTAEYLRILKAQDPETSRCPLFQKIAALSAIESVLKDACA